ncbi:MAG TPA: topology modulation protein [Actinomycetota bacterium]|nr:topology modulation protein [Actinomycetota bacterium]
MERVAIIGSGGAGKSRLATQIAARTGLPLIHLDPLFWRPGWSPAPADEARQALHKAIARDRWILDGNFLSDPPGADPRFNRTDTVIFIDRPPAICLWRAISRLVRDRHRWRPDLPEGCVEGFDLPFYRWVWSYRRTTRPQVLLVLARLSPDIEIFHLRSNRDVRRFLLDL